jgi:hypothetical protein
MEELAPQLSEGCAYDLRASAASQSGVKQNTRP